MKVLWIVATNPVVSQPDAGRFAAALKRAELVIVQDAYFPTETGALAHVLLPAAQWPEKDGTMTNSERRVSLVRSALAAARRRAPGLGDLRPHRPRARVPRGVPVAQRGRRARRVRADHGGPAVRPERHLARAAATREGPLQWPCPSREHPGTERLYTGRRFGTPDGRARLAADAAHGARGSRRRASSRSP